MLQEPLEEGGASGISTRLQTLLSGLALCLTLLTVAQQYVEQLSHPPSLLTQLLDHCWELLQLSVRTELDLGYVCHGGRRPLQHAPELEVKGDVEMASPALWCLRVQNDQHIPGSLHLCPVYTDCRARFFFRLCFLLLQVVTAV